MFATAEGLLTQEDLLNSDGLQEVFATNLFGHFLLVHHRLRTHTFCKKRHNKTRNTANCFTTSSRILIFYHVYICTAIPSPLHVFHSSSRAAELMCFCPRPRSGSWSLCCVTRPVTRPGLCGPPPVTPAAPPSACRTYSTQTGRSPTAPPSTRRTCSAWHSTGARTARSVCPAACRLAAQECFHVNVKPL